MKDGPGTPARRGTQRSSPLGIRAAGPRSDRGLLALIAAPSGFPSSGDPRSLLTAIDGCTYPGCAGSAISGSAGASVPRSTSCGVRARQLAAMKCASALANFWARASCVTFPGAKARAGAAALAVHLAIRGGRGPPRRDVPVSEISRLQPTHNDRWRLARRERGQAVLEYAHARRPARKGTRIVTAEPVSRAGGQEMPRGIELVRDWRDLETAFAAWFMYKAPPGHAKERTSGGSTPRRVASWSRFELTVASAVAQTLIDIGRGVRELVSDPSIPRSAHRSGERVFCAGAIEGAPGFTARRRPRSGSIARSSALTKPQDGDRLAQRRAFGGGWRSRCVRPARDARTSSAAGDTRNIPATGAAELAAHRRQAREKERSAWPNDQREQARAGAWEPRERRGGTVVMTRFLDRSDRQRRAGG